jgi:D-erythro-7,8-dihydroneopterin triphosphate epimerase
MARDTIRIRDLELACMIGVNPDERTRDQPLLAQIELALDLSAAGRSGAIADTCNYDRVADEVAALLKFRRYRLLESAAEEVSAMLLAVHPDVESVRLRLDKPEALRGRAGSAGVEVLRRPSDFPRCHETARFGTVEVVLETEEAGLYLLHVAPGASISAHHHQVMRELEWHVRGELTRNGERLVGLAPMVWSKGQVHDYVNTGVGPATVFCCDQPRFIPVDEILVQLPNGTLGPV